MQLLLVGTSHHHSSVELRERLSLEPHHGRRLLEQLAGHGAEAAALSTCNRCCLYLAGGDVEAARRHAVVELASLSGMPADALEGHLFTKAEADAAHHLFRVASGLDSLVPGEAQILGQVRAAYDAADTVGTAGPILHRLFHQALHAGKRVRSETGIGENPASVSSAAADLAGRMLGDLASRRVLLIGAGTMAELAAANLVSRGVVEIVVANRSLERAYLVAARTGGRAVGLHALEHELATADVVVSSTGSPDVVVRAETVAAALRERPERPMLLIDIAVPRDLDPAIGDLDGAHLCDLDDLEQVVEQGVAERHGEVARAEQIVLEELEEFRAWWASRDVVPAIVALRAWAEEIRRSELVRHESRLGELSPGDRKAVESLTAQLVNKLLHAPTVRLKEAAVTAEGRSYAETVRELFGLREGG
jgi:glutamyl-tRNA reductase